MTDAINIICGTLIALSVLAVLFMWTMKALTPDKNKREDVHMWDTSNPHSLADSLLILRDQGYTIKSVIVTQYADHRNAATVVEAIIITEK